MPLTIAPMTALATAPAELVDGHGRVARDLRVSLTDRCNLRCTYCMPAQGMAWLPGADVLTDEELLRLIGVAVCRLGVRELRFTGGEPLLRGSLESVVAASKLLRTDQGQPPKIALTTNGIGLAERAAGLRAAGLDRVNVSLDSLAPARYAALARRDRLPEVLAGLSAAQAVGLTPVKVNTVVMRGVNEPDVVELVVFCLRQGYQLRFIEQMPLGPIHGWDRDQMVSAAEILGLLAERFELNPAARGQSSDPAALWTIAAGSDYPAGTVGVIASVTAPFCGACDRTRLTADGQLRTCLFTSSETDLRGPLRAGADDDELAALWRGAHLRKQAGHGIGQPGFGQPARNMSAIGG